LVNQLTYKPFGNRAILIEWLPKIDLEISKRISAFKEAIFSSNEQFIQDCIVGYNSLTVIYSSEITDFECTKQSLELIYSKSASKESQSSSLWKIPVCYDSCFGLDLKTVSKTLNLPVSEIILLHSKPIYNIHFIGFLPGFLYLGGMDSKLEIKRKTTPRLNVARGSVAIGGSQTGIYPSSSSGGWNIIGKTPISFFNIAKEDPCFARPGDQVQFVPISLDEFKLLETQKNDNND
jgi:inhibitor of KinA